MSKKRAKVNRQRRTILHDRYGDNPPCFACLPLSLIGVSSMTTGCRGRADDGHELMSRARSTLDENLTDPDGVFPVSRSCHQFITSNPDIAEAAGLAFPSRPVRQPLRVVDPWTGKMPRSVP